MPDSNPIVAQMVGGKSLSAVPSTSIELIADDSNKAATVPNDESVKGIRIVGHQVVGNSNIVEYTNLDVGPNDSHVGLESKVGQCSDENELKLNNNFFLSPKGTNDKTKGVGLMENVLVTQINTQNTFK